MFHGGKSLKVFPLKTQVSARRFFMKVLVATDGSETSMKAVARALELAEKQGAQVTIMSVAYYGADYLEGMPPNIKDKLEDEARSALKKGKALFDAKNLPVEMVLEAGLVPANLIIRKAQEGKFDRIVIGSTGLNALERILMGSTAAKVVAHAPCEVTVVR
jgi:nucleotide-binding universal stress UspA family protein